MKRLMFLLFTKLRRFLSGKGLGRIPGVSTLYSLMYNKLKPKGDVLIDVQGNKMYVNSRDRTVTPSLLAEGIYESYTTEVFKKLIRANMTVVDIGANVGYYTLIAAKLVGNNGKVYAFEPEPNNYNLLVKNILINKYANIIPIQKAVSNKIEKTKFFIDKINLGGHSLSEDIILEKAGFIEIETITLDKFFRNKEVDFVKMDAEGAEGLIINGAKETLKNNLKIIMEFLPRGLIGNIGTDPLRLLHELQDWGFKIKLIDEVNQCIRQEEMIKIIELCETARSGRDSVNLLLEKIK